MPNSCKRALTCIMILSICDISHILILNYSISWYFKYRGGDVFTYKRTSRMTITICWLFHNILLNVFFLFFYCFVYLSFIWFLFSFLLLSTALCLCTVLFLFVYFEHVILFCLCWHMCFHVVNLFVFAFLVYPADKINV